MPRALLPTAAAGGAARPHAALFAVVLFLAVWPGRADAFAHSSRGCTAGDEITRLRCLLDEKDALIDEQGALIDQKNALIEESKAKIDQQRAVIEALQVKKATDLVDIRAQQAQRSLAAPAGAPKRMDNAAQDPAARAARHIDGFHRTWDILRGSKRLPTSGGRQEVEARRLGEEDALAHARRAAADGSAAIAVARGRAAVLPGQRTALLAEAGQLCTDDPPGWVSMAGDDCHVHVQSALCTPDGDYGDGWSQEPRFAGRDFGHFAANNATALTACCGCGGGNACTDTDGWIDKNGNTCADYAAKGYCDGDGGTGAGWPSMWGAFANQALAGKASADIACCACRPRARDASGRSCDYYAAHPDQCGCCDDEDFRAQLTCSSVCPTPSAESDLTRQLAGWTNDTRMIIFPPFEVTGTLPSDWSTRFPHLQTVKVSSSNLEGTMPQELGLLPELRLLDLSSNSISGSVPAQPKFFENTNLRFLYLNNNQLTGTVPSMLGQLVNLEVLELMGNQLTGSIPPELGNLLKLQELGLSSNQLDGTVPSTLGRLAKLRILHLDSNQFTGPIPPDLGNLPELTEVALGRNNMDGTIPSSLCNLTQVTSLILAVNQFTGTIPPELGRMGRLKELMLGRNQLEGTLPLQLGSLGHVETFQVSANKLTGTIPPELIGNFTNLIVLDLAENMFEGTLPSTLGNLAHLELLYLWTNRVSGPLPAELCKLSSLSQLVLSQNRLSGTVPSCIDNWTLLHNFVVDGNSFTGPVPKELGLLQQVTSVDLTGNNFTSMPAELDMQALQSLKLAGNRFMTGAFPNTTGCPELIEIDASNCSFTTAGPVGAAVRTLNFRGNSLTSLPGSWVHLPAVTQLGLAANNISTWSPFGVLPLGTFNDQGTFWCGREPLQPRLKWPNMEKVDFSGNHQLGSSITLRDFLWSFGYVPRLLELWAPNCGLQGDVPKEGEAFAWDMPNTGKGACSNVPPQLAGYPTLMTLDLSGNKISSITAPPPGRVSQVRFGNNDLAALHAGWYRVLGSLDVSGNPLLRFGVDPPKSETGCPSAGVPGLQADGFSWTEISPGDAYQCTTLCVGTYTRYKNDPWLNVSSLCRCKVGRQGTATNCSACPPDTFSDTEDQWGMVRTCRACPALSTTDDGVENATGVDQCRCPSGWYMGMVPVEMNTTPTGGSQEPACIRCEQGLFQTTAPGAIHADQCLCNASYSGLRQLLGKCGCVDDHYMDHVARECRPCYSGAEECTWGVDVQLSLKPPVVKAGYWTERQADLGPGAVSNFSKNVIWRCVSVDTCHRGGTCAKGRQGHTCSLCQEGMFGGPDGECTPCPTSPAEACRNLILGVLLVGSIATVAVHQVLRRGSKARAHGSAQLTLQSLTTSVKQVLNYVQMLGALSVFSVNWPPLPKRFMVSVSKGAVAWPQAAGAACLTGRQTASVEMGFRWLLPVAGLVTACLTALLLYPVHRACREYSWSGAVRMDLWDVLRVSLWGVLLYYSTLLQFGAQVLTCTPNPNGKATVLTFPHLVCPDSREWQVLAGLSCAFLATFVVAVYVGVYCAWRRTSRAMVESQFKSMGWWGFPFGDFRCTCTHWAIMTMSKDAVLVIIAMAGAADGSSQLLTTAAAASGYSYLALRDQPYNDPSNSVLEAWTIMSLAFICIFGAAMGYPISLGLRDVSYLYEQGVDSVQYKERGHAMFIVQCLTFLGPAAIITCQLATISPRIRKRLPMFLRRMDDEERRAWSSTFCSSIRLPPNSDCTLPAVLEQMDSVELQSLRHLMGITTATMCIMPGSSNGIQAVGRRSMARIASELEVFTPELPTVVKQVVVVTV